jgi:hypothetical protein
MESVNCGLFCGSLMGANLSRLKILEPYSGDEPPTAFSHVLIWEAVFDDVEGRLFLLD